MEKEKFYAVITGDIAGSSRLAGEQRRKLLDVIHQSFQSVEDILGNETIAFPFEVFRGDSFQGVLAQPEKAFIASIIIRAEIRKAFVTTLKDAFDARIAIGIGTIDLMGKRGGEGDGDAYRYSGLTLDKMEKSKGFLNITTPWEEVNKEFAVECALLDTILSRWTAAQVEVVIGHIAGKTQEEMAEIYHISQPGILKRFSSSNFPAIEMMEKRYIELIERNNPVGLL
jgi:hypothetical protein